MTTINTITNQALEVTAITGLLQNLPSGKLILSLQKKLNQPKFTEALLYISEFVLSSLKKVGPEELLTQLESLDLNKEGDKLVQILTGIIENRKDLAVIINENLEFAVKLIARLNRVKV